MDRKKKNVDEFRGDLLLELKNEIDESFGGNKTKAAEALGMHRAPFTNLCNGKERATIDKLIEIGMKLGWKIELLIKRDRHKK